MTIFGSIKPMKSDEDIAAEHAEKLREGRVRAARGCAAWSEITPLQRLCPRGPARYGWVVDSDGDQIYVRARGHVFNPGTAVVLADRSPFLFVVNDDGDVEVFEPAFRRATSWSEMVAKNPSLAPAADAR